MSDLAITSVDVVCPVGLNAAHACAAIRAGLSRLAEYDGYFSIPPAGPAAETAGEPEPVVAGRVPTLPADLDGSDRLLALALAALQGIVAEGSLSRKDIRRAALLVALPAPDPSVGPWRLGASFAKELCRRSGVGDWAVVQSIESGPAGALKGIDDARALLSSGRADLCVLLAADTLVSTDSVGSPR